MAQTERSRAGMFAAVAALAFGMPDFALAADAHRRTCVKTIHVPAVTKTVHERVTIPGRTIDTIVPTQRRTTERLVVTSSGRERIAIHPPRYRHVETVTRTPDRIVERHIPARTKAVRRKVMLSAARTVHKPCVKHGHHTTCAVHLPATYGYRTEHVVTHPARVEHRRVRGRDVTSGHRVLVAPGAIERTQEGPAYARVHVSTPEVPQHLRRRHVPAQHRTVARQVVVTPAHTRQVHVPCGH